MSRKKLDDSISTQVTPYAVFSNQNKRGIVLNLSKSLVDTAGLKHRDRVDLFFERHSEIWGGPVIIIKKGGTQRSVYKHSKSDRGWWSISVTQLVRQFDISTLSHRMPMLDYIEGVGEIVIDMSIKSEEELDKHDLWKSSTGRRVKLALTIKGKKEISIYSNEDLLIVVDDLRKRERKTRTQFILDAVRFYIEDKYKLGD